jgi:hypothetical protein
MKSIDGGAFQATRLNKLMDVTVKLTSRGLGRIQKRTNELIPCSRFSCTITTLKGWAISSKQWHSRNETPACVIWDRKCHSFILLTSGLLVQAVWPVPFIWIGWACSLFLNKEGPSSRLGNSGVALTSQRHAETDCGIVEA